MAIEQYLYLGSAVIALALVFDFTNGFHDSANAIATVVSTKVLSPGKAVSMSAFFNLLAALVGRIVESAQPQGYFQVVEGNCPRPGLGHH